MLTSRASPAYQAQHHVSTTHRGHSQRVRQRSAQASPLSTRVLSTPPEPAHPTPGLHLPLKSQPTPHHSFLGLAVNDSFSAVNIHKQQFPLPGKTPLAF